MASVEERILSVGDRVMVVGIARWEAGQDDAGSYRETGRTLTMEGSPAVPLLIGNWDNA